MTMFSIRRCLLLLVLLGMYSLSAQDVGYWQPQVALNYQVTETYSHNFSIENRNFILRDDKGEFSIRHIDLNHFSKWTVGSGQSVALGVKYRFRAAFDDGGNELRFTQQFNTANRKNIVRFGHRLRTEQRIFDDLTIHRFRYRFTADMPLQGEKLDIGETYLVANVEWLLSAGKALKPSHDQRFTAQLGWQLAAKTKLQLGLEHRFEQSNIAVAHVTFLLTSAIFSL